MNPINAGRHSWSLFTGEGVRPGASRTVGAEADPAVRNTACSPRDDDAGSVGSRQNAMHSSADESDDWLRWAAQGDADEPEGDHGAADVRAPWRRD